MPKISEMFPSKYLTADVDVPDMEDGGLVVTISHCEMERVGQGAMAEDKIIVYFREVKKGLVLNKTNGNVIADLFKSDDTDDWDGRKILLYAKDVEYQGKMVRGIRVSTRAPKGPKTRPRPEPAYEPGDNDEPEPEPATTRPAPAKAAAKVPAPDGDGPDDEIPF